jgi:glycosyltransferase involved in cell wall biosynthesis
MSDKNSRPRERIVFLASAWGPRHGGINSFNADLVSATARSLLDCSLECICVTADIPGNQEMVHAKSCGVDIIQHAIRDPEYWTSHDADSIHKDLLRRGKGQITWCVGHDTITGEAAVALAQHAGGRAAVIHHTSYIDYASYKHFGSKTVDTKRQRQQRIFNAADCLFSVGPLLQKRLAEMLGTAPQKITALIPGLSEDVDPPQRSNTVSAIVFGRLDNANERIKQGRLAVAAFGSAVKQARKEGKPAAFVESPRIIMMGVDKAQGDKLQLLATSKAGEVVNDIAFPFLEDRAALLSALREANVAVVASWHEGFGLEAWEAIAAQVPLVLGRNTGVYQFLKTELSGAEIGFVRGVDVRGALDQRRGGHFRSEDERELRESMLFVASDLAGAQDRARLLRTLLAKYTWARTAAQLVSALKLEKYAKRLVQLNLSGRYGHTSMYESVDTASLLLSQARLAYGKGNYRDVYATSIRAAESFERAGWHTDAVSALIEAVSAMRPGRRGIELRRIILKVYEISAKHRIDPAVRWLFLDRFALVLFDYGRFVKGAQVVSASEDLFRRVPGRWQSSALQSRLYQLSKTKGGHQRVRRTANVSQRTSPCA